MSTWRLTKSLARFRRLVDERWPDRDHASDGTIGDTAHQAETSGHNPDDTAGSRPEWNGDPDNDAEVRAFDMDSDLREPGTTAQMLVDHLRALPSLDKVFRYIIFDRKIYRAANGWKAETYTGASAHTEHIHFSGAYTQAADDNETFDFRLGEVGDMELTDKIGDKANPNRTVGDVFRDMAKLRGVLVGDKADTTNAALSSSSPLAKVLASPAQLVAIGNSLMTAIAALASKDNVDERALAEALAPAVAAAVLAGLPDTADQISQDEVTTAVRAAFADAFGQHE